MKRRIALLVVAALLAVTISPSALAAEKSLFTDMDPETSWSYTYVSSLARQGVVNGYPDGTFRPAGNVTYGEAFKLILLAVGVDAPKPQPGKHWAYPYIKLALDNQLVYSFDSATLDTVPTRRMVARMAARALDFTDISGASPYDDCDDGYVVELYEKGIMDGFDNEDGSRSFHPEAPISREQMAAIVYRMMTVDATAGMFRFRNYWLDPLEGVPANPYTNNQFTRQANGRLAYSGGYYTHGVDVSRFQQAVDWQAVAGDGIDFAIIRAGGRAWGTGALYEDALFDQNVQGAIDAGLDVGVYLFSNAITVEEAVEEADLLLSMLEPYRQHITYPVVCDWEYLGGSGSRAYGVDALTITKCVDAFCQRVAEAGYQPMFYINSYCGYVKMDLSRLTQYPIWFAEYTNAPTFRYDFQMWQYSSSGRVAGISGEVDMNLCFVPYDKAVPVPPESPAPEGADPGSGESDPPESQPVETPQV